MAKVEYVDFYEKDMEDVVNVIKSKGLVHIPGKKVFIQNKFMHFGESELSTDRFPEIFLMRNGDDDGSVRNAIGFSVEFQLDQLSFETVNNGKVYKYSGLGDFKADPTKKTKTTKSKLFYKVCFYSLDELSRILDELIKVHRKI